MAQVWNPFSTTPTTSAVGDAAAEGTDPRHARADHKHGREAFAAPTAVTPDAAAGAGTSTSIPRADHQHGIATYSLTPVTVTATGGAGTSGTAPARGDHSHAMGILTTRGDLLVFGASAITRLALGTTNQILQSNGTDAVWVNDPGTTFTTMYKWATD